MPHGEKTMSLATSTFEPALSTELLQQLAAGEFDFIDLGAGTGESITKAQKKFQAGPGIGFDLDAAKVTTAQARGIPMLVQDVTKMAHLSKCVSFVTMMDFLEHLYSRQAAKEVLQAAVETARDFLFIRHPNFDNDEYLAQFGLKFAWSDWTGHQNMMTVNEFHQVFRQLGGLESVVIPRKQVLDSSHRSIVPLSAPTDTIYYDEKEHGKKEKVFFEIPVYTQFDIFVRVPTNTNLEIFERAVRSSLLDARVAVLEEGIQRQSTKRKEAEKAYERSKAKRSELEAVVEKLKQKASTSSVFTEFGKVESMLKKGNEFIVTRPQPLTWISKKLFASGE
jgi:hypothetical protein